MEKIQRRKYILPKTAICKSTTKNQKDQRHELYVVGISMISPQRSKAAIINQNSIYKPTTNAWSF